MTLVREFNLYLNAGKSIPLVINVNQYDYGEQWVFTLYSDNGTQYTPSSGAIVGIKSDNLGIINTATVDNQGRVVVNETQQMTAAVGKATFELLIDGQTHGTANFFVLVEPKPGDNADLSESDYSLFQEAINGTSATAIAEGVATWMDENLTPTTPVVDASLSVSGAAADAKKTGDEISDLKSQIAQGMPFEVKTALDSLLHKVGFLEDSVDDLAVIHAWATDINLVSISAVFTQGANTIYDTDSLDYLKQFLVVTATYDNGTTAPVSAYTLSGELTEGTSVITATYEGETASFNVTVTHAVVPRGYTAYDYVYGTSANATGAPRAEALKTQEYADINSLIFDFDFVPVEALSTATAILGGLNGNGNDKQVTFFTRTDTQRVSCFSHNTAIGIDGISSIAVGNKTHVRLNPNTASPSTLTVDDQSTTGVWASTNTITTPIGICGTYQKSSNVQYRKQGIGVGTLKIYDLSENLLGEYIPCVRDEDNVIGVYDTVANQFLTTETASYATIGNANCRFAVGNLEA